KETEKSGEAWHGQQRALRSHYLWVAADSRLAFGHNARRSDAMRELAKLLVVNDGHEREPSKSAVAAIDGEADAADIGGGVGGEEDNGAGDLRHRAAPAERRHALDLLIQPRSGVARLGAHHVVAGVAGIDGVDADIVRPPFHGELAAEL